MKIFQKNNILIARFSSIGDVVLTTPIIRAIKEQIPNVNVSYLTTKSVAPILQNNPFIDNLFVFEKSDDKNTLKNLRKIIKQANNNQKYDIVVDLQNNIRSKYLLRGIYKYKLKLKKNRLFKLALVYLKIKLKQPKHVVERYFDTLKNIGVINNNYKTEIFLNRTELSLKDNVIGIAHGSNHFTKQWPPDYFAKLMEYIHTTHKVKFYLFGSMSERLNSSKITNIYNRNVEDFTGKLTLSETIQKISECKYFISNDTGLMHIASALNIPVVAIFGSTVPELGFTPYGIEHKIAQVSLGCRPCSHIGRRKCPRSHFNCMKQVLPEYVYALFEQLTKIEG